MSQFADNPIASEYKRIQNQINWYEANEKTQLDQMRELKSLLQQVPGSTTIFDFGLSSEHNDQSVGTAASQLVVIKKRIARFEFELQEKKEQTSTRFHIVMA